MLTKHGMRMELLIDLLLRPWKNSDVKLPSKGRRIKDRGIQGAHGGPQLCGPAFERAT